MGAATAPERAGVGAVQGPGMFLSNLVKNQIDWQPEGTKNLTRCFSLRFGTSTWEQRSGGQLLQELL